MKLAAAGLIRVVVCENLPVRGKYSDADTHPQTNIETKIGLFLTSL